MEESAILGFPAVHCRQAYERPEGMELGTLVISDIAPDKLASAVQSVTHSRPSPSRTLPPDYTIDGVSRTVARIIQSYTPIVNRVVWKR